MWMVSTCYMPVSTISFHAQDWLIKAQRKTGWHPVCWSRAPSLHQLRACNTFFSREFRTGSPSGVFLTGINIPLSSYRYRKFWLFEDKAAPISAPEWITPTRVSRAAANTFRLMRLLSKGCTPRDYSALRDGQGVRNWLGGLATTHFDFTRRCISGQVFWDQYLRTCRVNQLCTVVHSRVTWATVDSVSDRKIKTRVRAAVLKSPCRRFDSVPATIHFFSSRWVTAMIQRLRNGYQR